MSVEIFSKDDFEKALPTHKDTGERLWGEVGLVQNEYTYRMSINEDISIIIRSSVGPEGLSANTGEDSIRAWLVDSQDKPLGSKVTKWTTRLPGWDERLIDVLRTLWGMAQKAGYCPKCKVPMGVWRVKNGKPENKGKLFKKCRECGNGFAWLEVTK